MPVFQPGVPTGLVDLDVDYQNLQDNFEQLNIAYGVDHVPFSDTSGVPPGGISGMHTIIHLQSNAVPAATATVGQLFNTDQNDNINTDTILWFLTGGGKLLQLTRNFVPTQAANGRTFLPGGLILQWGNFNPNVSVNVFFPFAFPAAVYNIQFTGSASNNSTFRNGLLTGSLSQTGFTWEGTIDTHWNPIYYMAIGI